MKRVYVMDCGDFVKIGVSENVDRRKNQIKYDVKQYYCTDFVENPFEIEKDMHSIFWAVRSKNAEGREYFSIDFETAVDVLKAVMVAPKKQVKSLINSFRDVSEIKYPNRLYKMMVKTMFMDNGDLIFLMCVAEGLLARKQFKEKIDKEKIITEKLKEAIPKMSDFDKGYILGKVENLADNSNSQQCKKEKEEE